MTDNRVAQQQIYQGDCLTYFTEFCPEIHSI